MNAASRRCVNTPGTGRSEGIDMRFRVGDRVRIPQDGWDDTSHHDGTVTAVDGLCVFVVWDEGPHTPAIDRWFAPNDTWTRLDEPRLSP
jgi:hypothetical protein